MIPIDGVVALTCLLWENWDDGITSIGANPMGVQTPQKFGCGGLLWFKPPRKFHWNKFNISKFDTKNGFVSL